MERVTSKDGTSIAYEKAGRGPALILVDGALCHRAFGPSADLSAKFQADFTVYRYDRRGRGESTNTEPYAVARELEDLSALVQAAGGSAVLVGVSSGAALALEAAATGLGVRGVVAYEPPFMVGDAEKRHAEANHQAKLQALVSAGKRGDAVKYFMRDMVNVPGPVVVVMRLMFWVWPKLEAVAHTLPYDAATMNGFVLPKARLGEIRVPVLVGHGGKTDQRLIDAAAAVASAIPGSTSHVFPGQTHNVSAAAFHPAARDFLLNVARA